MLSKIAGGILYAIGLGLGWLYMAVMWTLGVAAVLAAVAGVIALAVAIGPMWVIAILLLILLLK